MYKTADFDFNLPEELIASNPVFPRDSARMLVNNQTENFLDKQVNDLADFLEEGDVIVFNDTKVIKAKLTGFRDNVKININLHASNGDVWQVFAKPAKRLKINDKIIFADDFYAVVLAKDSEGLIDLKFNTNKNQFFEKLEKYGQMPLPPYIKRSEANKNSKEDDEQNYQTIFANNPGAVAAPTAGLHFTSELLKKLADKGIKQAFVTLNVGAGTFLPVKSEYIKDHPMHSEFFSITKANCEIINNAKKSEKKVIAVGTTSLRVLESIADKNGKLTPQNSSTKIFIYPPYKFKIVDILLTNFHLPKSTLFMLVSAFIGKDRAYDFYQYAISKKYRFYSYGDCGLLYNQQFQAN